ncbi:unnamed protein product [Adineta ricciae]|uniref:Shisa N-terminal domain-containing protein n=1 Tax=Adineta ricciae TaxID=249248 RepID=A0A814CBN7_ADIRI|nr:unnamed protein product [Adineta ricciae]CAF0941103.1 unnamed protein product [Adineta ricciae]
MARMTTTVEGISKPPSAICSGFIDVHGVWNNGFECPIQQLVQYFCCGSDNYHYCCTPERFLSDISSYNDQILISGQYQPSDYNAFNQTRAPSLVDHSKIVNKQFEQFQKIFLPIFLLTSSVLFLIGLAIWFWLYKHKAFYATERDYDSESNTVRRKTSQSIRNEVDVNRQDDSPASIEQSRRTSYPTTEV